MVSRVVIGLLASLTVLMVAGVALSFVIDATAGLLGFILFAAFAVISWCALEAWRHRYDWN